MACEWYHDGAVRLLCRAKANINAAIPACGRTAFMTMIQYDKRSILKHLIDAKADVNSCPVPPWHPLILAQVWNAEDCAQLLLRAKAMPPID